MDDSKEGWITEPIPLSAADTKRPRAPRFAIPEQHWNSPEKFRAIDDFRASGLNDTVSVSDANIPQGLDGFIAICSARQRLLNHRELLAFSVYFAHAYKQVPLPTVKFINKEDEKKRGKGRGPECAFLLEVTGELGFSGFKIAWGLCNDTTRTSRG